MKHFFEEIEGGEETALGSHEFTKEAIIAFATRWDPQRFHIDEAAAADSMFGGLCASGWHTSCVAMRLIVDTRYRERQQQIALGKPVPLLGVSPGVANLRWPTPTRPGDVIRYRSRLTSKRETKRPEWGLVGIRTWGVNARGEEAIAMDSHVFVGRRPR